MPAAIIVHGGASNINPDRYDVTQAGCKEAALSGWRVLQAGGSALDAVEAAVRALEDNPEFNAGTGACLNSDGNIELDSGVMDGHALQVGAIAGVERIKNPISLARSVLESPHVLLVGRGAEEFALEQGITQCTLEELITERQFQIWQEQQAASEAEEPRHYRREVGSVHFHSPTDPTTGKHGTVGAVALDMSGALAAATSTGGIHNKYPGRVGDSPLVGCGFYADEHAAVSCTGHGEDFVRLLIAKRAADFAAGGQSARDAARSAIATLSARATGTGGLIVVDRKGEVGFAWNSRNMSYAYMMDGMDDPIAGV
ncbi:MAG TPA: isoaspartyl peptidase/L-asparaginase [Ktedonobacteraceae bacterium]|nr:isoaspartyl peptidase/L-asparaginase [Ktedonobacteraceae bacterium]